MGIFSRRDKVVDLSEDYRYERKKLKDSLKVISPSSSPAHTQEGSGGSFFNFFGNPSASSSSPSSLGVASSASPNTTSASEALDADEKRRRLAKRLKDMTDRIEDMSNQIYLLQQRIEVLEKKNNVKNYE